MSVLEKLKKRFYISLYGLLTQVQQKYGTVIDDNIIIATVFLGYDMESFRDPVEGEENAYNLDDSEDSPTKNSYIGNDGGDTKKAFKYFENDTDTLKTLINNFIGYRLTCYGISTETPVVGEDSVPVCNNGLIPNGNKCVDKLEDFKGTFFESIGLDFNNDKNLKCQELGINSGYNQVEIISTATEEVSPDFYWTFLENSKYLDKRETLREYYVSILGSVKKKNMKDLTPDEYALYNDEIVAVRKRIIKRIKELVENYQGISEKYNKVTTNQYWWPIGSDETNEVDGVIFANGEPSKTNISSNFGTRDGEMHSGIDIPGDLGVTNVIASKDGVVVYSSLTANISCDDNADETCGSGYGNYVIVEHIDGNHTVYAHLYKDSIVAAYDELLDIYQNEEFDKTEIVEKDLKNIYSNLYHMIARDEYELGSNIFHSYIFSTNS